MKIKCFLNDLTIHESGIIIYYLLFRGSDMQAQGLIVDGNSPYLKVRGMNRLEFDSDLSKIRKYSLDIIKRAPEEFKEKNLMEQQISEILKNAIEHGNKQNPEKIVKVWYRFRVEEGLTHIVVEDQGAGFSRLEEWNEFFRKRTHYIETQDFENMMNYINYTTEDSTEMDGGNAMFAAVEYWNGGIIYNEKRNRVALIKRF